MFRRLSRFWGRLRNGWRRVEQTVFSSVDTVVAVVKSAVFSFSPGRNTVESWPVNLEDLVRLCAVDGYVARSVRKYVNLVFKAGWRYSSRNDDAAAYVRRRLELAAMASGTTLEEFFSGIALDLVKYANCFLVRAWVKEPFRVGKKWRAVPYFKKGIVGAYFRAHPATMYVKRDEDGRIVEYEQRVRGKTKTFQPDEVVHIAINRDAGMAYGYPILYSALEDVRLLRQLEEHVALMVYRHVFPLVHYKVGLEQPGKEGREEEIEALRGELERMPADGALITTERHSVNPVRISVINAEPYLDYFENRVFADLGVSQVSMGRGDSSSRATADTMAVEMYDEVRALQSTLAAAVTFNIFLPFLLEGRFNPIENPDDMVSLVFNEVDTDLLIKRENHEVFKFEHNAQTWEEMRLALGMDMTVDESRLYYRMIQMPLAVARMWGYIPDTDETDNRENPQNQYTQGLFESWQLPVVDLASPLAERMMETYTALAGDLHSAAVTARRGARELARARAEEALHLAFEQFRRWTVGYMNQAFARGVERVRERYPVPAGQLNTLPAEARVAVYGVLGRLHDELRRGAEQRLRRSDPDSEEMRAFVESRRYRLKALVGCELARAYVAGVALAARLAGVEKLIVRERGGSCEVCAERNGAEVGLDGSYLELAERLPPYHPYCDCDVEL